MLNLTTSRACEYHELLAGLLSTQDAVISFNYDCLMDRALRDKAGEKWRPEVGYGTTVTNGASSWTTHVGGEPVDQSIRLLKMHGSMNWLRKDQSLELIPDPTTVIQTNSIIPPTWCKDDLATSLFGDIWRAAGRSLREAQVMVAVGYSLPDIDVHSRSLLRAEAGYKREDGTPFKLLVLVNKDAQARRRFREIMRNGLAFSTPVLEYPTLADLAQVLKPQESP
jgi:hypothetical protein